MQSDSTGTEHSLDALIPYETKIFWKDQLIHLSKSVSSTLEINRLIESILHSCLTMAQITQVGVLVAEAADTHNMTLHNASINLEQDEADPIIVPEKSDFTKAILIENIDVVSVDELDPLIPKYPGIAPVLAKINKLAAGTSIVPLRNKSRIIGIILLGPKASGEKLTPEEKRFLHDLGAITASAVANARLYELATTDMMTKLKIHHFFQTRLREEMEISEETNHPLSLILTDIDHFKPFNDTYGHQVGDVVLKEVAGTLLKLARANHVPSRYGGEEFAVILPGMNGAAALEFAENVRRSVEQLRVKNPQTSHPDKELKVTVSIGVAEFNSKIDFNNHDIIERCDQALYRAKHSGRNRVEMAFDEPAGKNVDAAGHVLEG
ncbi:MAG: sensor domain-containing diguanylate cyclase [Leptospiraceae bacterium]|nr:sensor domain-containing diguanylate cyclase [Leptospiraceae bacterium]MCB1200384.1 sensor domain-containing diguanylate cyclase [Leptospiraceae bacterium]